MQLDPRLFRYATATRWYLVVTVALSLAGTGLILAQAGLLARALAGAITGTGVAALSATLIALLAVVTARAGASYGGEIAALQAAARVKSQLRLRLSTRALRLGPAWLGGQQAGQITTLATRGLDALDAYFARYLPQLVLACLVPVAVLIRVAFADWLSAVAIAATLPLIPVFAILVGRHTTDVADAHRKQPWILSLSRGWHTQAGPRGVAISGGEQQRLALARALLADPAVLILDEPAAHLDPDDRHELAADLLQASRGHATLLITRDLDGLDQVDEIIVLDHGKVTERGTHDELIAAGGTYRQMWAAATASPGAGSARATGRMGL